MIFLLLLQTSTPDWQHIQTIGSSSNQTGWSPQFGRPMIAVNDLDGDGVEDLLISAYETEISGAPRTGVVEVRSGKSRNLLYTLSGSPGVGFGFALESVGDIDLDGLGDFLVTQVLSVPTLVHLVSGGTGTILRSWHQGHRSNLFGSSLSRLGDLDHDGVEDFAVGTGNEGTNQAPISGAVWAYSGATGTLLFEKRGWRNGQQFGMRLRGGRGDVDGDGSPDLLVMDLIRGSAGRVAVFSGATQSLLYDLTGTYASEFFGSGMDFVPDLDGDGCDEVVIGSPNYNGNGFVSLFSGRTGDRLWTASGFSYHDLFGEPLLTVPDVNGDDSWEVLAGAPSLGFTGAAALLSGRTGNLLSRFDGPVSPNGAAMGTSFASLPPDTINPLPLLFIGAVSGDTVGCQDCGEVYLFEARPFLQPSTLELSAIAGGTLSLAVDFPDTEAGQAYQVLASTGARGGFRRGGLEIPLVPNAFFHSFLHDTPAAFAGASGTLDAAGDASATLTLAPGALAAWVGRTLKVAAVSLDANRQPSVVSWARAIHILP